MIFSTISLKFKCKIFVQKEVIHSFKNHILVTWPATDLLIVRKWCWFGKQNHYYFVQDMTHEWFFEGKIITIRFSYSVFYWTELNEIVWDALVFFRLSLLLVSLNLFLGWERFLNEPHNVCLKQRHALHFRRKLTPLYLNVDKVSLLHFSVKI